MKLVLVAVLTGAVIAGCSGAVAPTGASGAPPPPVVASAPAPLPIAAPPIVPTTQPTTTTTRSTTTTSESETSTASSLTSAECIRIGNASSEPLAELLPRLRARGCGPVIDALERAHAYSENDGIEDDADIVIDGEDGYSSSGEAQYEYGCQQGYITEDC